MDSAGASIDFLLSARRDAAAAKRFFQKGIVFTEPPNNNGLVTTGGAVDQACACYWLLLAESHLTRRLFAAMVPRITALPAATR